MPAGRGEGRKLTRVQIALMRRGPRKRERFIATYEFPAYLWKRVGKRLPGLSDEEVALVEQGLREWFVCCAWRWGMVIGMPSRAVDEAWHELILDTRTYAAFCERAFGEYLHHTPDEAMGAPMKNALEETVRAWDRSEGARERDSILWDLDERLGVEQPLSIDGLRLAAARSRGPYTTAAGWGTAGYVAPCFVGGDGGGGDSGGGGCGGGGCGGGGS